MIYCQWSEQIATTGRETQKQFLQYCMEIFRQALLLNYKASQLVYSEISTEGFQLEKFAPFVHGNNILKFNKSCKMQCITWNAMEMLKLFLPTYR